MRIVEQLTELDCVSKFGSIYLQIGRGDDQFASRSLWKGSTFQVTAHRGLEVVGHNLSGDPCWDIRNPSLWSRWCGER